MASSSPPPDAISDWAHPPLAQASSGDPFSPALEGALSFLDEVRDAGLAFAPSMPEPEALRVAARQVGISPAEALKVYLTILNFDA